MKRWLNGMKINFDLEDSISLAGPKSFKELFSFPGNFPGPHTLTGSRSCKPSRIFHSKDNLRNLF